MNTIKARAEKELQQEVRKLGIGIAAYLEENNKEINIGNSFQFHLLTGSVSIVADGKVVLTGYNGRFYILEYADVGKVSVPFVVDEITYNHEKIEHLRKKILAIIAAAVELQTNVENGSDLNYEELAKRQLLELREYFSEEDMEYIRKEYPELLVDVNIDDLL